MKWIQYNPIAIRRIAQECKSEAETVDTSIDKMVDYMSANTGKMREQMDQNIIATQKCMQNSQNLLIEASNFMTQLAEYLELLDSDIAQKIGE